ncbi:MAG: DUF4867 family protein [Clostridia bacterium]|nr:DUF4867 family protein [Clostridia bacterium]
MLEKLKQLNKEIELYDVTDQAFSPFGRVIAGLDVSGITEAAETIRYPDSGSAYLPSVAAFEALPIAAEIRDECFGTLPTQIGYCYGHNRFMNATEWHISSEVNIAVTPVVLILGHVWDLEDNAIDASRFKAFYLPAGAAVEVYATSLHYTPCEVEREGFGCVVALPLGTNTPLEKKAENPLLIRRNKWLISHVENKSLIESGAAAGITGPNVEIRY